MNKFRLRLHTGGIDLKEEVKRYKEHLITYALQQTNYDCNKAAEYLNVTKVTVYGHLNNALRRHKIATTATRSIDKMKVIETLE